MPYPTAEIRWFSNEESHLWQVYREIRPEGKGLQEQVRTDYYLLSGTENTGIKVREGNHEWKLKFKPDEQREYGLIQYWKKWSTEEEQNILKSIDKELLGDWIEVRKQRFKKQYEILDDRQIRPSKSSSVKNGCDLEFTTVRLPLYDIEVFTIGLETFGEIRDLDVQLLSVLNEFEQELSLLKSLPSQGYAEWLKTIDTSTSNA